MASVQDYIRQADQLASQGKYEKAVQIYEKLIKALKEKGKIDLQFFQLLNKAGDIYYNSRLKDVNCFFNPRDSQTSSII